MLCNVRLSKSSLAPAKLREHFTKVHGTGKYKDATLTQFKQKRVRKDANVTITPYGFVLVDKPILTASYEVAYLIAKQGKPDNVVYQVDESLFCYKQKYIWGCSSYMCYSGGVV